MLDYNRLTYAESAALAGRSALFPERTPSAAAVERLHAVADYCARFYQPSPGEADLVGLFLFRQRDQAGEDRNTMGLCHVDDSGNAVIGLSIETLQNEPFELYCYIFFHELAHLTEIEHNDAFTERLNSIMVLYFNRDTRMDSREKRRKAARKLIF